MKTKSIYIVIIAVTLLFFTACKKDLGNYEYHDLPELRIDNNGSPGPFTIKQRIEELEISPVVQYSGDKSLDYYWIWGLLSGNDTVSRDKILKTTLDWDISPSPHKLVFQVVERETGRMAAITYDIFVTGSTGTGLIVGHEKDGTADIDLINLSTGNTGILRNIHQSINNNRLAGHVSGLGTIGDNNLYMFMTDQAASMMTADGMVRQFADREIFGLLDPKVFAPQDFAFHASNVNYFVNDGQVYQNFVANFAPGPMTQKVAMADGSSYRVAPNIILTTSKGASFYDELGKRIIQMGNNSSNTFNVPVKANEGAKFSFDNIDRKLLFARKGFQLYSGFIEQITNTTVYAFFADHSGNGRYLYIAGMETPAKPDFALMDITAVEDIQNATFFEVVDSSPSVYYATDSRINLLNLDAASNSYVQRSNQFVAPAGEEISCIKVERTGAFAPWNFYIATYSQHTGKGKVYQYPIATGTGLLAASPTNTWTDFEGRITKMELKRY